MKQDKDANNLVVTLQSLNPYWNMKTLSVLQKNAGKLIFKWAHIIFSASIFYISRDAGAQTRTVHVNEITSVTIQINCSKLAKDDLFWIGMHYAKKTKEFKWLSGKPLRLPQYWYEDKPPAKPEGKLNRYPQHHL